MASLSSQSVSETCADAAFAALPASVAVLDQQGTIISVNDLWRRFAEENGTDDRSCGAGCNYLDICHGAKGSNSHEASAVAVGIRAVLKGETNYFSLEYPCDSPEKERWFLLIVSPIPGLIDGEKPRGAVVMHLDISDRKQVDVSRMRRAQRSLRRRAAQLLRVARSLKASNKELEQFAYVTSHDLRAPLRGIANLSRWIEEDMGERFTPEASAQMELLRGRVHRMEALIDAILKFSRVGRTNVASEKVDVRALIMDVLDLLTPPPEMKFHLNGEFPVLFTPRVSLQQVLMNLIGNAIKHHHRHDGNVWIECRDTDSMYEFTVRDDGPGIAKAYHEKIFVIFQTLQARDRVEGTGVGLALVKKIVEQYGGKVWLESAEGKGATFRFLWPGTRNGARINEQHGKNA